MYKIAASAAQLVTAFCFMLMYSYSSQQCERKQKLDLAYLITYNNIIFDYNLRIIEAKNP